MNSGAVLVVEDEPMILMDIETALEEAGFEVIAMSNAARAIDAFDARPEQVRGLITDIRLGAGQNGWALARHLRRNNPSLPVVYISGDSADDWSAEGVPNSIMITKPFFLPQIITGITTLLNQQQSSGDLSTQ